MKKLLLFLFIIGSTPLLAMKPEMVVILKYIKKQIPKIEQQLIKTKASSKEFKKLEKKLNLYKVVKLIGEKNVKEIKKMTRDQLIFDDGRITLEENEIKNYIDKKRLSQFKGKLTGFSIGAENALPFAVFFSAPNVFNTLLNKNLPINSKSGMVYFISGKDYIAIFKTVEEAIQKCNKFKISLILLKHRTKIFINSIVGKFFRLFHRINYLNRNDNGLCITS